MMEKRLEELRREFKVGQAQLEELDQRRAQLRDTLLRISGAIQVLEELLSQEAQAHQTLDVVEEPETQMVATR